MFQADQATPRDLLIAGLAVLGAIVVAADLVKSLDRLRFAGEVREEIDGLPETEPQPHEGGPPHDD